jgi:hypothetical protein
MKKIILLSLMILSLNAVAQKKKLQQDKEAILAMTGCYKVTFNFAETFSPDTAYKFHKPYYSWGIELVTPLEVSNKKIVLQHLLIVDDSTIIKHWRQDWLYENTELYQFDKENHWKRLQLSAKDVKGQWTQKVYQVDDSPRYEGTATWTHVDGKHVWENTTDAPLPRREFTKRSDYNVLKRRNKVYMTEKGWMFEQDNQKILRKEGTDKLLAWEKGFENFTKLSDDQCLAGTKWWNINQAYWADVRYVWNEVYNTNPDLSLKKKVDDTLLWEKLFKIGDESAKNTSAQNRIAIRNAIEKHLQETSAKL